MILSNASPEPGFSTVGPSRPAGAASETAGFSGQVSPLPYGRQSIDEDDIDAVVDVLRGDWLTTGPAVELFEGALSDRTGAPTLAVSSGTAALHTAYAAAGVERGSEVVTSPMTFVATAATASLLGANIVFADVEPDTANLDVNCAEALVSGKTLAITGIDYAGHPVEADALGELAHTYDALFIEDAAHSVGSLWHGRPVGSLADLTTFSFYPTKNFTTAEGGAVSSPSQRLLDKARMFRNHGLVRDRSLQRSPDEGGWHQEVHQLGLNYRLPDVLCALGLSQLARVDRFKQRRAEVVSAYNTAFASIPEVATPPCREGADPMWHLYPLRVLDGRRRQLYDALRASAILVQVNYLPVYWHPAYAELGYRRGMCPHAERFYTQQLSLPLFPAMSDDDVDRVITEVSAFFATH